MKFKILNSKEKREFEKKNNVKVRDMLIKMKDKLRIYTGNITRDELLKICGRIKMVRIGLTFDKQDKESCIK